MASQVKLNAKVVDMINKVMIYYSVTGKELEFEKQRIRDNPEEAVKCYDSIYNIIKR